MSYQKVTIVGRLGADPESKQLEGGTSVCNLSVATTKSWTKDGQKNEKTEWHRIVCFNKTADLAAQYLSKGKQVLVEGELQTRSWDKDGVKMYSTEVLANRVVFLSPKEQSDNTNMSEVNPGAPNMAPNFDASEPMPF